MSNVKINSKGMGRIAKAVSAGGMREGVSAQTTPSTSGKGEGAVPGPHANAEHDQQPKSSLLLLKEINRDKSHVHMPTPMAGYWYEEAVMNRRELEGTRRYWGIGSEGVRQVRCGEGDGSEKTLGKAIK
jgi:hypothetical protein